MIHKLFALFMSIILINGCNKDEPVVPVSNPFSVIQEPMYDDSVCAIKVNATLQGFVDGDEPSSYGFVYSHDQWIPTLEESVITIPEPYEDRQTFTGIISDFNFEQDLYVSVYAQYNGLIYYGSEVKKINQSISSSKLYEELPMLENCGSEEILLTFEIEDCFPSDYEYGIEYSIQNGIFASESFKVKKGTFDGNGPISVISNLQQESDGRNAFRIYVQKPNSNNQTNSNSYLIPNFERSTSIERLSDFPGPLRGEAVAFTLKGKGYVCGGYTEDRAEELDDLWEYTPETDSWVQKASIPGGGKALMTSFTTEKFAYVGTGGNAVGNSNGGSSEFYRYDPIEDSWEQIADYPKTGLAALGFSIKGVGYVGGMLLDNGQIDNQFFKYVEEEDKWSEIATFPGNFFGARNSAITASDKGYILLADPGESTYFEYNPETSQWNKEDLEIKFDGNDGVAFQKNGKIYQFTGRRAIVGLELDFVSSKYSVLCTDPSIIRSEAVGFNLNGSFYIATGIEENSSAGIAANPLASVYKIDVD